MRDRERRAEGVVAAGLVAAAAAMLAEGWNLKPGLFEPIGSGAAPNTLAVVLIGLTLAMLGESAWRARAGHTSPAAAAENWPPTLLVFGLTIAYVLVLVSGQVRYQWATLVYVPAAILVLADRPRAAWPAALGVGAAFAFGLDALFRHILVTDLP